MNLAGSDDERPGDDVEGVRYFDFSSRGEHHSYDLEEDPFAAEGLPDAQDVPPADRPNRSERGVSQEPEDLLAPVDPFEFALVGVPLHPSNPKVLARAPEPETPHSEVEPTEEEPPPVRFFELATLFDPPDTKAASRERFATAFDTARAGRGEPFLAIALRMARRGAAAEQFPIVVDGIRSALHPGDVLLADEQRLRLAAVLHGRPAADAQRVFVHLAEHLRLRIDDADGVLSALSVLAAPDGRPFETADMFLARVFDRD